MKCKAVLAIITAVAGASWAATASPNIRVNQMGYLTGANKIGAVVKAPNATTTFKLISEPGGTEVFSGTLRPKVYWSESDDTVQLADFSGYSADGVFRLSVPGVGVSHPFKIGKTSLVDVSKGLVKAYYFARASTALTAPFAGVWARPAAHMDEAVKIHNTAVSPGRDTSFLLNARGGWYDAADYNLYMPTANVTVWTLLTLAEQNPEYIDTLKLNIPESSNGAPDVLDEILWELRWMLRMQDPYDGGVYFQLSSTLFGGMTMPHLDPYQDKRYVVAKSAVSTFGFAAAMAKASSVLRPYEAKYPGLADSCLNAAKKAWTWGRKYPDSVYQQGALKWPTIKVGLYLDATARDEMNWAGMELYAATKDASYWSALAPNGALTGIFSTTSWQSTGALGLVTLLHKKDIPASVSDTVRNRLRSIMNLYVNKFNANNYAAPLASNDFVWGSNGVAGNIGMLSLNWYRATGDTAFRTMATGALDWILGRNSLGVSYVLGFGAVTPKNPHSRISISDNVVAPVPGWVVGGPNKNGPKDDGSCDPYPTTISSKMWIDSDCSYASNETTINWNAPVAYLAGSLQAMELKGWPTTVPSGLERSVRGSSALQLQRSGAELTLQAPAGQILEMVRVLDVAGREVAQFQPKASALRWTPAGRGVFFVHARVADQWQVIRFGQP